MVIPYIYTQDIVKQLISTFLKLPLLQQLLLGDNLIIYINYAYKVSYIINNEFVYDWGIEP